MLKNPWFISTIIYLVFFFWYTNTSGPLSQAEIDLVIERIDKGESTISEEDRSNFLEFLRNDDGGDFYMVNFLDLNENPPIMEMTGKSATASDLLDYYMEYMYPELLIRASHPVFAGNVSANALDHIGAEETKIWDQTAIMRYRSIRDMLEIGSNEIFSERHKYKDNALIKTIAIPVSAPFFLDFRIFIFIFLLSITLIIDRLKSRK
ncbi:MAG: hypothetical protein CMC84_07130 [Flavobacteriaceae bacterium]|nr:hypothetical protein [Flavobacteriaceae bacterium]|tara:strand:- start:981 stop:1601 length:621 start_codon:yes stop_codon:yes gene_type:complete